MTAFDHPTVRIYRRNDKTAVEAALAEWEGPRNSGDERLLVEGAEALRAGRTEEARARLDAFTRRHPDILVGQFLLGEAHGSVPSLKGTVDPFCVEAALNRLLALGMPGLALKTAELFIEHVDSSLRTASVVSLHFSAGLLAKGLKEPARAADHFEKAFALNRRHWQSRLEYARLCVELGRRVAAETAYEDVLRLNPDNAAAIQGLEQLQRAEGRAP